MDAFARNENPPLQRDNASAAAAALIRTAIVDGRLQPGQRLKEGELAEAFGISRTPVREALMMLQVDGLITTVPHRGSVVRAYAAGELEDMFELRGTLESFSVQRACERRTEADMAELAASIDRLDGLDVTVASVADIWRENVAFHMGIATAAHTAKLIDFLRNLFDLPVYYQRPVDYSKEQKDLFVSSHRKILAAIRDRDAALADVLIKAHIFEARAFAEEQSAAPAVPTNGRRDRKSGKKRSDS